MFFINLDRLPAPTTQNSKLTTPLIDRGQQLFPRTRFGSGTTAF